MQTPMTLTELQEAMPQIAAYGIQDINQTQHICRMLQSAVSRLAELEAENTKLKEAIAPYLP